MRGTFLTSELRRPFSLQIDFKKDFSITSSGDLPFNGLNRKPKFVMIRLRQSIDKTNRVSGKIVSSKLEKKADCRNSCDVLHH
jgi:hypothetical protein